MATIKYKDSEGNIKKIVQIIVKKGDPVLVDSNLSTTSENPVQNKIITNKLAEKANKDEIPDVSQFVTNAVDDLVNYYKKTETYSKEEINALISEELISEIMLKTHPIGSYYLTNDGSTNPADIFGGTWIQVKDAFLYASGDTISTNVVDYSTGVVGSSMYTTTVGNIGYTPATGGSTTHYHTQSSKTGSTTLTAAQSGLPKHSHALRDAFAEGGNVVMQSGTNFPFSVDQGNQYTSYVGGQNASQGHTHTLGNTNSSEHLPPYWTVFVWQRIA